MTPPKSPGSVRGVAALFAIILGLQAAWVIAAEAMRPSVSIFPGNMTEAKAAALNNAAVAAWIGWPRGKLWADYAVTANARQIGALESNAAPAASIDQNAIEIAEIAAALEPSDARSWILLALNAQAAPDGAMASKAGALLKMSYYTSPFSGDLFPLRIQVATRSTAMSDEELASYAEYELGAVVRTKPALKPAIAAAYRHASATGRTFLDRTLTRLDPVYSAQLKSRF